MYRYGPAYFVILCKIYSLAQSHVDESKSSLNKERKRTFPNIEPGIN